MGMENRKELNVSLVAGFVSVKFLPAPFTLAYNNFNPKLILGESKLEYRGAFSTNRKSYRQIEIVDCAIGSGFFQSNSIRLQFKDSIFTFSGNVGTINGLKEAIKFFKDKGCNLSEKAGKLVL